MHIVSVDLPRDTSQPLAIKPELFNNGSTKTAVSQSQFGAVLSTAGQPWLYSGGLSFQPDAPAVFAPEPSDRVTLAATSLRDDPSGKLWSELAPAVSPFRIYINS